MHLLRLTFNLVSIMLYTFLFLLLIAIPHGSILRAFKYLITFFLIHINSPQLKILCLLLPLIIIL